MPCLLLPDSIPFVLALENKRGLPIVPISQILRILFLMYFFVFCLEALG